MYKNDKQFGTKEQNRRRDRRGKNGREATVRQMLASDMDSPPDMVLPFKPASLVKTVSKEYRVAVAMVGVHAGYYDDPRVTGAVVDILEPQFSS